jgi:hypothetical protein
MTTLIDIDFIEIGTSDFESLAQSCRDSEVGISIEPIKYYLDRLPNKTNVTKINCAISFDNSEGSITVHYVPSDVITANNLPAMLKGCNSISGYHYQHKKLNIEHLVVTETVTQIPISKLLEDNKIGKIGHLKIDTEGGDCYILEHLYNYLKDKDRMFYPSQITFESNQLTDRALVFSTIELFRTLGYRVQHQDTENTILELQ